MDEEIFLLHYEPKILFSTKNNSLMYKMYDLLTCWDGVHKNLIPIKIDDLESLFCI